MRNPKLLCLLRRGCILTFPSGVTFRRIADTEFIESGMQGEEPTPYVGIDTYDLTEKGLEEALEYEESVAFYMEEDEELETQHRREEMQ